MTYQGTPAATGLEHTKRAANRLPRLRKVVLTVLSWQTLDPMFCICPIDLLLIYGTDLDVNPDADVQKSVKAWKEQCIAVTELVLQPFKTMVTIAMCLGLRVSEILGLRWGDFDWEGLAISIQRAYVLGAEDQVKTMYSERQMPLDPALAEILFRYRRTYAPEATADDWVFSNPDTGRPWWPHRIQQCYIRKAGIKVVGVDGIGWHTFRHTYSSMLRHLGVDVKVQQELLRHADIRTTMNIYTQAMREDLRAANSRVVRMVIGGSTSSVDPN